MVRVLGCSSSLDSSTIAAIAAAVISLDIALAEVKDRSDEEIPENFYQEHWNDFERAVVDRLHGIEKGRPSLCRSGCLPCRAASGVLRYFGAGIDILSQRNAAQARNLCLHHNPCSS